MWTFSYNCEANREGRGLQSRTRLNHKKNDKKMSITPGRFGRACGLMRRRCGRQPGERECCGSATQDDRTPLSAGRARPRDGGFCLAALYPRTSIA